MRETRAATQPITLEKGLAVFLAALSGKNRSQATIRAYQTDILQFITFLHEINVRATTPQDVEKWCQSTKIFRLHFSTGMLTHMED